MKFHQAIILSLVQGITEFLPISSSGHLVFLQKLMPLESPPVFFDVLVHLGTLLAIIVYFRREIIAFFKIPQNFLLIFIGTLPAAFFGLLLEDKLEMIFNSLFLVGIFWLVNSGLLFSLEFIKKEAPKKTGALKWQDFLFIGLFQALALFPGISRAGSTITAGLWRNQSPESALQISFFLSLPATLGALFLQILNFRPNELPSLSISIISLFLTSIVGFISLFYLEKILKKGKFPLFGFYCLLLGLTSLVFSLAFH